MLRTLFTLALAALSAAACSPSSTGPLSPPASRAAATPGLASSNNIQGIGSAMPAFYDGKIFTINFSELPAGGETANLIHNGGINNIYQSDACEAAGKTFTSVIDAVPGDGMNPLWQEVQVVFANTSACQQFTSDDQVLDAAAAGTVTLVPTGELYRCSVIAKPK